MIFSEMNKQKKGGCRFSLCRHRQDHDVDVSIFFVFHVVSSQLESAVSSQQSADCRLTISSQQRKRYNKITDSIDVGYVRTFKRR